jgi:dihydroxy-acid dehydratase
MTETTASSPRLLRSRAWFDDPANADMTALYLERYMNFGLTLAELQSGRPIVGIAQTGSDLSPCNRHHLVLATRLREGIRDAGGVPIEFPVHPIQETGKRPTAGLDRNLAYMGLVEILYGYPIDGVVLTVGCDKTTPACLMAAATVDIPAIALSVGPMISAWAEGKRIGSGTVVWRARERFAAGEIDRTAFIKLVASAAPSTGYCNTMGTATTMNSLAEVLGMSLPGSAAIPAPHRDRQECAYETGRQIVEMIHADRKPSDILKRESFINAIRVNSALGGSTNAPLHLIALARHVGVELSIDDWQYYGYDVPLLVNLQPAGEYLGEDFYRAGGVPAVVAQLLKQGLIFADAPTANGHSIGDNCANAIIHDEAVIRPFGRPLTDKAGFLVLRGNLFDSAIMKTSVISREFRERYLADPNDPEAFEGQGVHVLPCIGDGRQSGTSGSPSILNASPEAAIGGGLAVLRTGDRIRVDLKKGQVNVLVSDEELRQRHDELKASGGYVYPESQTPWQEMQRAVVSQIETGAVLEPAVKYQRIARTKGTPRHNH